MIIRIICVGKPGKTFISDAAEEYVKRLSRYVTVNLEFVRNADSGKKSNINVVKRDEGKALARRCTPDSHVIALHERGKLYSTAGLTKKISFWRQGGKKELLFLIGGAYGLGKNILAKADLILSLSPLTFPHQMARLLLAEQLYRCYTILGGEQYHK